MVAIFQAGVRPAPRRRDGGRVPGRRRVFLPMTRVTSIDAGQVVTTGLVNMRRFEQRGTETLLLGEVLDRTVSLRDGGEGTIEDLGSMETRHREWRVTKANVRKGGPAASAACAAAAWPSRLTYEELTDIRDHREPRQGAASLLAAFGAAKPADLAEFIHELAPAAARGRRGAERRAAGRRPEGASGRRPGRDRLRAVHPPGRRRPGGHAAGRRRGPARRAPP